MWKACRPIAVAAIFSSMAFTALADESNPLTGIWKIRAFCTTDVASKERHDVYGPHPTGTMRVWPDGRFTAHVSSYEPMPVFSIWDDVANVLASATEHAISYGGTYRIKGESLFVQINFVRREGPVGPDTFDMSWDEGRTIGQEERSFQTIIGSDQQTELIIETGPMPNPNGAGNMIIGRTVWQRLPD